MNAAITEEQAEAALDVVKAAYPHWIEDAPAADHPHLIVESGWEHDGYLIVWESGPDDWAQQIATGGSTESDRALFAAAAAEFGVTLTAPEPPPATWPDGVTVEPATTYALALYANEGSA